MKRIEVLEFVSTGLTPEYNRILFIEIEDKPFAEGAFGEVYKCISINQQAPSAPQIIKIFKEGFSGSLAHNSKTIRRLQGKFSDFNKELISSAGRTLTEQYPAFGGVPQFSFSGLINGVGVTGFSADNLVFKGYTDFEKILEDPSLLDRYQSIPFKGKLLLAYQLVSAFKILEQFLYIHADLKPGAIFINLSTCQCAIIDYDSGAITENENDRPNTVGAKNDWVAPEIWSQQNNNPDSNFIQVDLYTDRWSVAVGIHYLISTINPLFYLSELSPKTTKQYFAETKWPNADKNAAYFNKENEADYDQYFHWISSFVPVQIRDHFSRTINYGYEKSVARTTYKEWETALQFVQEPPVIIAFKLDRQAVVHGLAVTLHWEVENANTVEIENVGQVEPVGTMKAWPFADTTYRLKAIGFFGESTEVANVRVFPTPVMETLLVPIPEFTSRIELNSIQFASPKLDLSIQLHEVLPQTPKITELSLDSRNIQTIHKPKHSYFNLGSLYESIVRKLF